MHITIKGNPITKKNSSRIIKAHGRIMLIPSKQYKDYEASFIAACMEQKVWNKNINQPINVECTYFMQTKRKVDLANLLNGTDDALIAAKVIEDDNCSIIVSHDGSRVFYDKNNPRVEIEITEAEPTFEDINSQKD